jgi:methionyl-tRNA formyltransferase
MTTSPRTTTPQRILFFGMRCAFSAPPLEALIDARHEIAAIVLPGPPFAPPIVSQPRPAALQLSTNDQATSQIDTLATRTSAPVLTIGNLRHPDAITTLESLAPDVIAVACFPALLPPEILQIPRLGGINVHPSLLPRGRGPEPLFWVFRRGERETGITIHLLGERFDGGPILAQQRVPIQDGVRLPDLELQLAQLGGTLLLQAIDQLATGTANPIPQDDAEATFAPIPCDADYEVPTDLPARWAFNFVRAVAPTTARLKVVVMSTKEEIAVSDAVDFRNSAPLEVPYEIKENRVIVRFQPGSVTFTLVVSANSQS